jgi:uroporphyrinogen-III decarboxylase
LALDVPSWPFRSSSSNDAATRGGKWWQMNQNASIFAEIALQWRSAFPPVADGLGILGDATPLASTIMRTDDQR